MRVIVMRLAVSFYLAVADVSSNGGTHDARVVPIVRMREPATNGRGRAAKRYILRYCI